MHYFDNAKIDSYFSIHEVGNKANGESLNISKRKIFPDEDLRNILTQYFLSSFKTEEYYHFYHDANLSLNEVYTYITEIFNHHDNLYIQSVNLAKHLYNQSVHPKINGGEFYVIYFKECFFNGQSINAIGLFKSESKDTFLEIEQVSDGLDIGSRKGININKLDKGCLIFNTEEENGYIVSIIDNTNKGNEAQYWKDDFLCIQPIKNEYHQTNQFLNIAKKFVAKQIPEEFEITRADQIDLLNRSVDYFKNHESFDKKNFEQEVFQNDNLINSFRQFDEAYRESNELELSDNFEISQQAVKKQARVFKSVLKLDKNFHIYIHGDKELIEQGMDSDGRKFYKIYYENES